MNPERHDPACVSTTTGPIRLSDPTELVAGLSALFGFWPRHSLMFLAVDDPPGRLGFRARVDLPGLGDVEHAVTQLLLAAQANGVSTVIVLCHSDDRSLRVAAVRQLADAFAQESVRVADALHLDDLRFWSLRCDVASCCPPHGRCYDTSTSRLVAEAIGMGLRIVGDRSELGAEIAEPDDATARRVSRLCDQIRARLVQEHAVDPAKHDAPLDLPLLKVGAARVKALIAGAVDSDPSAIADADAAELAIWCRSIILRDVAWSQVDTGDPREHLLLWSAVARRTIAPFEPAVLSLAAFCAWRCGDGARAYWALDRALQADPDYAMAKLVEGVLATALSPSLWRPVSEQAIWEAAELAQ